MLHSTFNFVIIVNTIVCSIVVVVIVSKYNKFNDN